MSFTFPTQYTDHNSVTKDFGPSRPISEGFETSQLIQQFDAGAEQRRKKGETRLTFDLSFVVLEEAAWKVLRAFFIARGQVESFNWFHPVYRETYIVRFNGPLQGKNIGHNAKTSLWEASCKLLQVF